MKVRLIHWNADEAKERAAELRRTGLDVDAVPFTPAAVRTMTADPPDAIVIDLSRLPSQGRDAGLFLRQRKATRGIPLLFVDGDRDKLRRIKDILPDATYTTWQKINRALDRAIARRSHAPVVPGVFAGYAGAPLAKKLGLRPHAVVGLINAPSGFERQLGTLPDGVMLRRNPAGRRDLTLWFVRSRQELDSGMNVMKGHATSAGLWILWPKRNPKRVDVSQVVVRRAGLAAGIVDFKISSIDEQWSGLRFTERVPRP